MFASEHEKNHPSLSRSEKRFNTCSLVQNKSPPPSKFHWSCFSSLSHDSQNLSEEIGNVIPVTHENVMVRK